MPSVRHTKWQLLAAKKYPRMLHLGGDGEFILCSSCPHQQTRYWRYVLVDTQTAAETINAQWDQRKCNPMCEGPTGHRLWRLK